MAGVGLNLVNDVTVSDLQADEQLGKVIDT